MLATTIPASTVAFDPAEKPTLNGTAAEKREQFYAWLNSRYPTDLRMARADAKAFIESPFGHKGAFIATVQTDTDARLRKTGNPHPSTRKRSRSQVLGGSWSYQNAVNNARLRSMTDNGPIFEDGASRPPVGSDGKPKEFIPEPRKWGQRVHGTPWVVHKDKDYLELMMLRSLSTSYYDETGDLDEATIRPFKPAKRSNAKHQGVTSENEVILRDYTWQNVHVFTYAGRNIYIED